MSGGAQHLIVAPIVVPLLGGVVLLLLGDRVRGLMTALSGAAIVSLVVITIFLLGLSHAPFPVAYRLGDWPAEFGIVLVLDRLAALMLVLAAVVGLAAFVFALAGWARVGIYFHPLLLFQLAGINGAVLAGDIFNLFVFFEVMLAASYGLALHGSGIARVRAGLHYIAINLAAAALFLVGIGVLYGATGTLNMAELAARIQTIEAEDRALVEAGAALMGVAFLTKAAIWPLGFWLVQTYTAASPPAAAVLSLLSKVGICAVLRLWLLAFGADAGPSQSFAGSVLTIAGLLTVAFGSVAALASQSLVRVAAATVIVSSGTLLCAIAAAEPKVTAGALFYLMSSALVSGAIFLLIELVERGREAGADMLAVTREAYGAPEEEPPALQAEIGILIPAARAVLGFAFLGCALLLAGLPPLSGFLGKFAILAPLLGASPIPVTSWLLAAILMLSGLAVIIAMTRTGIEVFWAAPADRTPLIAVVEIAPVLFLLLLCAGLTVAAGVVFGFVEQAALALHTPALYRHGVLGALP